MSSSSRQNFAEEFEQRVIELLRSLQRCEVTHARKIDELYIGNTAREIVGVFAMDDGDAHADLCQVVR